MVLQEGLREQRPWEKSKMLRDTFALIARTFCL